MLGTIAFAGAVVYHRTCVHLLNVEDILLTGSVDEEPYTSDSTKPKVWRHHVCHPVDKECRRGHQLYPEELR